MPFWKKTKKKTVKIGLKDLELDKPALIYLPSFVTYAGTNRYTTKHYLKTFERFLGKEDIHQEANIYAYSYRRWFTFPEEFKVLGSQIPTAIRYKYIDEEGRLALRETSYFAKEVMLPAMGLDPRKGFKTTDHDAALHIAAKMKNLTLVSYSYGTMFAALLEGYLNTHLTKAGFSQEDTKLILGSIVHIAIGNMARDKKKKGFAVFASKHGMMNYGRYINEKNPVA